jgi:hypothetical protein
VDAQILRTVGQVGGIGGVALGVLLLVFRDVIRKKIFPTLTKEQAYGLLRLVVLLVWVVALTGIAAWVWVATHPSVSNSAQPTVSANLSLDETRSSWLAADSEFLERFARPPLRKDIESYRVGEDQSTLLAGLWVGDVFSGVRDPLARMTLERDILQIMVRLAQLKDIYRKQGASSHTAQLDAAWNTIPDDRRRVADLQAFGQFMRFLYPEPIRRREASVTEARDQLVKFMAGFWKAPETDPADEASLRVRLLYDIILWRTKPVLRLRLNNPTDSKVTLGKLVVRVDAFVPMADTGVSGPVQELAQVHVELRGTKIAWIAKPLNVAIAHRDAADIFVDFESKSKGAYQLTLQLGDGDQVIWASAPLNLFFT